MSGSGKNEGEEKDELRSTVRMGRNAAATDMGT